MRFLTAFLLIASLLVSFPVAATGDPLVVEIWPSGKVPDQIPNMGPEKIALSAHDFGVRPNDHPCSAWTEACAAWLRNQAFLNPSTRP